MKRAQPSYQLLPRLFAFLLIAVAIQRRVDADNEFRPIKINNQSGKPVSLLWKDSTTKENVFLFSLVNGQETGLDTFVGHEFQLREVPVDASQTCGSGGSSLCLTGYFKVTLDLNQGRLNISD